MKFVIGGVLSIKQSAHVVAVCALAIAGGGGLAAQSSGPSRDYDVIVQRNPFGVRPKPPPPKAPVTVQSPTEIFLTGIVSIGKERAYFMTKPRPGQVASYYSLGIGEEKDGLRVVAIDTSAKSVLLQRSGVETLMTFQANGVKAPAVPTQAPRTTISGRPAASSVVLPATTPSRIRTIPSRPLRTSAVGARSQSHGMVANARPFAAEQDVPTLELQRKLNPQVIFPPTPGLSFD